MNYYQVPTLSDVYLEDSYVLGLHENDLGVVFDLEVVLTERHPSYHPPSPGEQYCYRKAELRFSGVTKVDWLQKNFTEFADASGKIDYGNIDLFVEESGVYTLEGDWGKVQIRCDSVDLAVVD